LAVPANALTMIGMKRFIVTLAVTVAALCATIPASAQAAPQLATGYWNSWTLDGWTTNSFKSSTGWVDVWSICRPISNKVRGHNVYVIWPGGTKVYFLPCNRSSHWLRRVGVPRGTPTYLRSQPVGDRGLGRTSVYGDGTRLPD
jgi:hypothetical protein